MKPSGKNIFGIIIVLFFWKLLLSINYPFVNSDGPWTLSHLFSLMIGDSNSSTFAHSFYGEAFRTHVLEILLFPLYAILPINTYTFIVVNFFFIAFTITLIYFIFNRQKQGVQFFGLTSLGFLSSIYTYGMRSENYIIPLILIIILLFNYDNLKSSLSTIFLISLFSAIAAFIHPMGGVVAIIIIISRLIDYDKYFKMVFLFLLFGVIASILVTWGEIQSYITLFLKSRGSSDDHYFWSLGFLKYIYFSIGIIPLIIISIRKKHVQSIIMLIISIIVISNFGRSYYFHYIFVILISIISNCTYKENFNFNFTRKFKLFSGACILIGMLFTYISPTLIFIENIDLGKDYRKILSKVDIIAKRHNPNHLLWVPSQFGMEAIDQKNARLHYYFYKHTAGEKIQLGPGDAMLFYSNRKMDNILKYQVANLRGNLSIEKLIDPSPSYLRIGTFYKQRADSLGLWRVSYKN